MIDDTLMHIHLIDTISMDLRGRTDYYSIAGWEVGYLLLLDTMYARYGEYYGKDIIGYPSVGSTLLGGTTHHYRSVLYV